MSETKYSGALGEVTVTVTPDKMYAAASAIEDKVNSSKRAFESMTNLIKATSRYWEGDAAEGERRRFENQNENFQNLISNLNNYVVELKTITGFYEINERDIQNSAQSLQADVIS